MWLPVLSWNYYWLFLRCTIVYEIQRSSLHAFLNSGMCDECILYTYTCTHMCLCTYVHTSTHVNMKWSPFIAGQKEIQDLTRYFSMQNTAEGVLHVGLHRKAQSGSHVDTEAYVKRQRSGVRKDRMLWTGRHKGRHGWDRGGTCLWKTELE